MFFKLIDLMIENKLLSMYVIKHQREYIFYFLSKRAGRLPSEIINIYKAIFRSVLEYTCIGWHPALSKQQSDQIEHIQKRCLSIACPDFTYEKAMTIKQSSHPTGKKRSLV